jgi:hypothetical protein
MILRIILIIGLFLSQTALSQKIIISGQETSRKLSWNDFTGKIDDNSTFYAFTYYDLKYRWQGAKFFGDSVSVNGFEVTLELNPARSWVKREKATDALLVHEQGHFNVGILCMNEILLNYKNATLTKDNYRNVLQTIFSEAMAKYHALGIKYDDETDHAKNKKQQSKWNAFFELELTK